MQVLLSRSTRKNKKWMVDVDGYSIHFGDSRYDDYTIHRDDLRKKNYISRHGKTENIQRAWDVLAMLELPPARHTYL
jgi:hypothetical protein